MAAQAKESLLSGYEGGIILRTDSPPLYFHQPVSEYHPASHVIILQQDKTENINTLSQQSEVSNVQIPSRPKNHLLLSLFVLFCCFCPTGIVALIYSCRVNNRYIAGDYAGAQDSSQKACYWARLSMIVGVVTAIAGAAFPAIFFSIKAINKSYTH